MQSEATQLYVLQSRRAHRPCVVRTSGCWDDAGTPCYVQPSTLTTSMSQDATSRIGVRLSGLPNHLCTCPMVAAMLDQTGLDNAIVESHVSSGARCGEARLIFSNRVAAQTCIRHFHGRKLDPSGVRVNASIDEEEVASEVADIDATPARVKVGLRDDVDDAYASEKILTVPALLPPLGLSLSLPGLSPPPGLPLPCELEQLLGLSPQIGMSPRMPTDLLWATKGSASVDMDASTAASASESGEEREENG